MPHRSAIRCRCQAVTCAARVACSGCTERQALSLQDADLDFGHVQPARMLGRVVELDPAQHRRGGLRAEHFFEALAQMRVEVVQDQVNLPRTRIALAQHPADEAYEVDLGAPGSHLRDPPMAPRLDGDEDVADTGALLLVIFLAHSSRLYRQGASGFSQRLLALLVQANHWLACIVGASIQSQQIVHAPAALFGELADTPHQLPPGFEEVS